jgi:hypothetical protein
MAGKGNKISSDSHRIKTEQLIFLKCFFAHDKWNRNFHEHIYPCELATAVKIWK